MSGVAELTSVAYKKGNWMRYTLWATAALCIAILFSTFFNMMNGEISAAVPAGYRFSVVDNYTEGSNLRTTYYIYDNHIIVSNFTSKNGLYANIESFAVFDYLTAVLGEESGYTIKNDVLCAADYGAPQKRMRFVVLGVRKDVADSVDFPKAVFDETSYRTVRDAIEDLETVEPFYDMEDDKTGIILGNAEKASALCAALRDSDTLKNHIATKTTETALERFRALKQGENFHSLDNKLKTNTYTDASRTQNTIYLRLRYDEPSGTVVNVRKSMWIHPVLDRAISIREAARLQTFPDSFVFYGSKDKQYQQVGNAVPPIMAKAIAEELAKTISEAVSSGDQNAR